MLVERDDSDWTHAVRLRDLTPSDRYDHAERVAAAMWEFRRDA